MIFGHFLRPKKKKKTKKQANWKKNNWYKKIFNAKYIDVVILIFNLIDYGDRNSKTPGSLWQCYRDEQALAGSGVIASFHDANNSALF